MKKLAIIVQRYGQEFAGGSEYLARWLALKLKNDYDIEILTTTAIDAVTWENHFPAGNSMVDGIPVVRFPIVKTRKYKTFLELSKIVFSPEHTLGEEFEWLEHQGPVCPGLVSYIDKSLPVYDLVIFITYLYYPAYFGLHRARAKSIFIPTAHDESPIYLTIYRHMFNLPAGIIFLAEEEKDFILKNFHPVDRPWIVAGIGMDAPDENNSPGKNESDFHKFSDTPYIFSCGRIESAKGYEELFTYFLRYAKNKNTGLKLVLAGNANMPIPDSQDIIYKGFVSDDEKLSLIQNAAGIVISSPLESFSLLALEAWGCGKAVIANGNSPVLRGHIQRGKGGWYYQTFEEFENILYKIENKRDEAIHRGSQGKNYAQLYYSEDIIKRKYIEFIDFILKRTSKTKSSIESAPI